MDVERVGSSSLVETKLPDGSRVIVDSRNDSVIALNASAGLAWEACSRPTTLGAIASTVEKAGMSAEAAEHAVFQLREKNLVATSEVPQPSRRIFMAGMAAVPIVAAMGMAEQRLFAERVGSLDRGKDWNNKHHYDPVPPHDPQHFKLP